MAENDDAQRLWADLHHAVLDQVSQAIIDQEDTLFLGGRRYDTLLGWQEQDSDLDPPSGLYFALYDPEDDNDDSPPLHRYRISLMPERVD